MEADLLRYYHVDYRDRWRGGLTLRRIWNLIRNLPADSATARCVDPEPVWQLEHVLLADIWQQVAHSKKPHPELTRASGRARRARTSVRKRRPAFDAALRRRRERQARIERGEIT